MIQPIRKNKETVADDFVRRYVAQVFDEALAESGQYEDEKGKLVDDGPVMEVSSDERAELVEDLGNNLEPALYAMVRAACEIKINTIVDMAADDEGGDGA